MPVIGHALAGLSVAVWGDASRRLVTPVSFGQRVLLFVGLAYIPDLTAQLGVFADFKTAPLLGHSLVFAAAIALVLTPAVARATRLTFRQAATLVAGSIVLHDVMDILQSPRRMPFWPTSLVINVGRWIPPTLSGEIVA